MVCEVGILLLLDIAVLARHGTAALPTTSFAPHTIAGVGIGVSMMFAFISFIGFESAALYGEETRNPKRSVPLATYISVIVIALFYGFTSWIAVGAVGASRVQAVATNQLGDLFFNLSDNYLDATLTTIMQILLCGSLFAGWLALHSAANRYMFVLGRERVLPKFLDAVHPKYQAPHRASLVQTGFSVAITAAFAIAGLDPYISLATSMLGVGTLGIVVLQALACVSVIGFYRNRPERHWWRTVLAPLLGFAGLTTATVLVVTNFTIMTGTTNPAITSLPWLILAAGVGGIGYAYWMRKARAQRYATLATVQTRPLTPDEPTAAPVPELTR
jgi:amino acid transporter